MSDPRSAAPFAAAARASARLRRAAAAERRGLERQRDQLLRRRGRILATLEAVDGALAEIDERVDLLRRLAGDAPAGNGSSEAASTTADDDRLLRGAAIRETAIRTLVAQPQQIEALHYRDWYELVRGAGYTVAGTDPLAVFLTQLSRSPVVRRSTQPGMYALDRAAPQRLRGELARLERELRETTRMRPEPTDLASGRRRRRELQLAIDRRERTLVEALRALALAELEESRPPPGARHRARGDETLVDQPSPASAGTFTDNLGEEPLHAPS